MTPNDHEAGKVSELRPCPFCAAADHLSIVAVGSLTSDMQARPYQVVCRHLDCEDVRGPIAFGRAGAIAAWNRSHKESAEASEWQEISERIASEMSAGKTGRTKEWMYDIAKEAAELALRTESQTAHYSTFDDWFAGQEGFALRAERFEGDVEWLRAAFDAGCAASQTGAVRVKALEFDRSDEASGAFAKYSIYEGGKGWNAICYPHDGSKSRLAEGVTKEQAITAINQHNAEAVLSALEPTPIKETAEPAVPADGQVVAWLDASTANEPWHRKIVVTNPNYVENNGGLGKFEPLVRLSDYQRLAAENERLRANRGDGHTFEVSAADAIKFLECACRNWSRVPRLSDDDIQDVAEALQSFLASLTRAEGDA